MALNQITKMDPKEKLYIPVVGNGLPPQSRTVIFLCQYCGYDSFDVVFVQTATPEKFVEPSGGQSEGVEEPSFRPSKTRECSGGPAKAVGEPSGGQSEAVAEPSFGPSKTRECSGGPAKAVGEPSGGQSEAVAEPSFGPSKTRECSGGPAKAVEDPSAEPMLGHNIRPPSEGDSQDYMIKDTARKFSEVSLKPTCSPLDLDFTLKDIRNVDWLVQQCQLPAIVGAGRLTCYSGLCAVLRRIVHKGLERHQHKHLGALLGFRQSCLKKCSEVSPWTRLCEIDIYQDLSAEDATPKGILQLERRLSSPPVLSCKLTKPIGKKKLKAKLRTPEDGKIRLEEMQDSVFQSGTLNLIDKRKVKTAKQLHKQRIRQSEKRFEQSENPNSTKSRTHCDTETGLKANEHELRPEFVGDGTCAATNNDQTHTVDKKPGSKTSAASCGQIDELVNPATEEQCGSLLDKMSCTVVRPPTTNQLIATCSNNIAVQKPSYGQSKEHLLGIPTTSEQSVAACKSDKSSSVEHQAATSTCTSMTNHQTSNKKQTQDSSHGQTEESLLKSLSVQDQSVTTSHETTPVMEFQHAASHEHRFAEGPYVTLTDFALFHSVHSYLHDRLGKVKGGDISWDIPLVFRWYQRMWKVPGVKDCAERCGLKEVMVTDGLILGDQIAGKATENKVEEVKLAPKNSSTSQMKSNLGVIREKLESGGIKILVENFPCDDIHLPWESFSPDINPSQDVSEERARHKREQIESLVAAVQTLSKPGDIIVDFCSGGGHVGIVLAHCLPDCHIIMVENNEESLKRAETRIQGTRLTNLSLFQCNLNYYTGVFNIGVALHACGVATDLVLEKCLRSSASFVCSPCCYGSARDSHLIKYPRSLCFRNSSLNYMYEDHLLVGHTAEQTSRNFETEMAKQAKLCMSIIDTDRAEAARERGYEVNLCSLSPPTCSPKNNLLIGKPPLQ